MNMEPYYEDDFVTLYHGDSLEMLSGVARRGSVSACITDPPYILQAGSSSTKGSKTGGWADMMNASHWYASWYRNVRELLSSSGSLWSFGNWRSLPVMMRASIDSDMPTVSCMVWDKDWIGPGGPQQLRSQHEICLVMARGGFRQLDRSQGDVLRIKASSSKPTGHPAEKPLSLMRRVVELSCCPSDGLILDPFTGSGTALVAAKQAGIRAIGIEAEERWCEVAARRLAQDALDFGGGVA